jgi:DNA polymerase I-like protein with 3'-5' exonuclease and polymerase domains
MAENTQQLRPLVFSELKPPMKITLVNDGVSLKKLSDYLERKAQDPSPAVGLDTETNVVDDFWFRRVRTIQIGDKEEQFVIDLLAWAGSEEVIIASQGQYGATNGDIYKPVMDVLRPVLCSDKFLKIGQGLGFEYSVFKWNFGMGIWHLYSTDMAERVIQAGTIPLKKMTMFSMAAIAARHFQLIIDKEQQQSFDLKSPLTPEQIQYAAFDIRFPFSMRQAQVNIMTADQLLTTAQVENDAIGTYTDMHLTGQNLDDDRWLLRIKHTIERRQGELKILDENFLTIVGDKDKQIDQAEIDKRYKHWKEDFEVATPEEMRLAEAKSLEKDKEKKAALGELLVAEKAKRVAAKKEAREACSELTKKRTIFEKNYPKCEGQAYINYGSRPQLLSALQQLPGMRIIKDTTDDTLLRFNDRPLIQTLRKYNKGKKDTGTYGIQWTQKWITKPLSKEGWRHPGDGRLHCLFNQLEAETGRSSSSKPNAQNLPKDDEVRACFICDPPNPQVRVSVCCDSDTKLVSALYVCDKCGKVCTTKDEEMCIVTADMSGAELRIIAELAQAKSWIMAFAKGQDVHSVSTEILEPVKWPALACKGGEKWFDPEKNKEIELPPCAYYALHTAESVAKNPLGTIGDMQRAKCKCPGHVELRQKTKSINFLLCYGGGPDALADELGITVDAAKELMKLHEAAFPDVWGYLKRSGELAQADKQARDMFGRRRSFPIPTWEMAKEWYESENADKLEIEEEAQDTNIFNFKATNLREPTKEEEYKLTHRSPDAREIKYGIRALMGSIGRRGKNHCIQGTNASIIKRAMGCGFDKDGKPYLWHTLPQYRAKIQNMVHDELVVCCPRRYAEIVAQLVGDAFKRAAAEVMHQVVMEFDYHIANRWMK